MSRRRRSRRSWPRRRILGIAGLLLATAAGAYVVVTGARDDSGEETVWRLHDLAMVQFQAGKHAEGVDTCRRILELRPDDAVARFNLGAHLIKLGREDEGWNEVRAVAAAKTNFDAAHLLLAQRALDEGNEDEALAELLVVVAEPPAPVDARAMLASLYRARGAHAEAMPHLRAVLYDDAAPLLRRAETGIELARLHGLRALHVPAPARDRGQERECYEVARRLIESAPDAGPDASNEAPGRRQELLSRALLGLGKTDQALAAVDAAIERTEDAERRADLRLLRAQVYSVAGFDEQAAAELDAAVGSDAAPSAATFLAAAELFAARGRRDRATEILGRAASAHPQSLDVGLAYGRELYLAGRSEEAEAELARVAEAHAGSVEAHIGLGDMRAMSGNLEGARSAYAAARDLDPDDADAALRMAELLFQEQLARPDGPVDDPVEGFDEAEALARGVLARFPEHPAALLVLGSVLLERAAPHDEPALDEALALLRESVKRNPLSHPAHVQLARAELTRGNADEAVLLLEGLLATYPQDRPELRLLLAQAYRDRGDRMRALEAARSVAALRPDDLGVLLVLSQVQLEADELEPALATLQRLEELQPLEIGPILRQATVLGALGRVAEAEERFAAAEKRAETLDDDRAIEARMVITASRAELYQRAGDAERGRNAFGNLLRDDPDNVAAILRFARFLTAGGDTDGASRQLQKAIALEPSNVEARRAYCEIWFGRGELTPELSAQVREIETLRPSDPVVKYLRGKVALLQGDLKLSRTLLAEYVAAEPADADGAFALGVAHGRAGAFPEAVRMIERAGKLHAMTLEVRSALAKTRQAWAMDLMSKGRVGEAQQVLRLAVAADPDAVGARHLLANALRFGGAVDLSEKEVRYLLRKNPDDAMARRVYAAILLQRREFALAAAELERFLEQEPTDWAAWGALASAHVELGDLDAAESAARRGRASAPGEPRTLAAVLHVLTRRGDPTKVEREIRAAIESAPTEAHYHYLLAAHHVETRDWKACVAAAERALDLDPRSAEAFRLLVDVQRHELGDIAAALATARARAPDALDQPAIQFLHGWLEDQAGNQETALAVLEPLVTAEPPHAPAVAVAAVIHLNRKETGPARDVLRASLAINPENADAHYLTAQSYLLDATFDGDWPKDPHHSLAADALRAAIGTYTGHRRARNNLAFLLARDEATRDEALTLVSTLLEDSPSDPQYLDTKGVILLRMERAREAVQAFDEALAALDAARRVVGSGGGDEAAITRRLAKLDRQIADVRAHREAATSALGGE